MELNALTDLPADLRTFVLARLLSHAAPDPETGCITYTGYKTPKGYGRISIVRRGQPTIRVRVHRAVWIVANGPIEDPALVVDHTCRNRGCINPRHLELVTNSENLERGDERGGKKRRISAVPAQERTECIHGHAWPEHLRFYGPTGHEKPRCMECQRLAKLTRRETQISTG